MLYEVITPAFAKVAVELLGGKICVERNPAGGATFLFTLPYMKVSKENKHRITSYNVCYTKLLRHPIAIPELITGLQLQNWKTHIPLMN